MIRRTFLRLAALTVVCPALNWVRVVRPSFDPHLAWKNVDGLPVHLTGEEITEVIRDTLSFARPFVRGEHAPVCQIHRETMK